MNVQRKRIRSSRVGSAQTELAVVLNQLDFDDSVAVNIHGLQIDIGMTPFGPDETLLGRWYVVVLPNSIVHDGAVFGQWLINLNTIGSANEALTSSEFVWGSGSFTCAEQAPFNTHFAPATSRNMALGSSMLIIVVADAVSGVVDNWDATSHITLFSS